MESYTTDIQLSNTEWANQLILRISSHIINGFQSIFNESVELCEKNDEPKKYLMTFQNLLSKIPHWNQTIIDNEKNRIMEKSGCSYLEDLITCIHVTQLRLLSYARAGTEPQKIEINIPELSLFLHRVYINIARKLYSNIYIFEIDIPPLEKQKRNREFELLVETCIMNTIRDNLPIEELLRKYIDETQEMDVKKEEVIIKPDEDKQKEELLNKELSMVIPPKDTPLKEDPSLIIEDTPLKEDPPLIIEDTPLKEDPPLIIEDTPLKEDTPLIIEDTPLKEDPPLIIEDTPEDPPLIIEDTPSKDTTLSWAPSVKDNANPIDKMPDNDDIDLGEPIPL